LYCEIWSSITTRLWKSKNYKQARKESNDSRTRRGGVAIRTTIFLILARDFFERPLVGLRHQKRAEEAHCIHTSQRDQSVLDSNALVVPGIHQFLMWTLSSVQESEGSNNSTRLPTCCGNAMTCGSKPRREKLSRHDERRGIRSEVGEEKRQRVQDDEADVVVRFESVVRDTKREHEDGHEEKALKLNDPAADVIDESHGEPVAGNCGAQRD